MYDLLTTTYWPWVGRSLAMKVGGVSGAAGVDLAAWERLALKNGLDPDRVADSALHISQSVVENLDAAYVQAPKNVVERAEAEVLSANKRMLGLTEKKIIGMGFDDTVNFYIRNRNHKQSHRLRL